MNVDPGLCRTCAHARRVRTKRGSTFFRCALSDVDRRFPKYPPLPVLACAGWRLAEVAPGGAGSSGDGG